MSPNRENRAKTQETHGFFEKAFGLLACVLGPLRVGCLLVS